MKKIISDLTELPFRVSSSGKKIVFTNGCFDLLHEGHLHLIHAAKNFGDILIVGVNDDASVKRLKGNTRPEETLEVRMKNLAAISEIDFIIPFSEDTPLKLIQAIMPDVLVKGGDYTEDNIAGAGFIKNRGGKIHIIPLLEGFSTSNTILKRVQKP
jgi:D-beta-D-heptose 7-phosphate kinase/D-beta-D-heptose 1-phosphate adenosyltransferase